MANETIEGMLDRLNGLSGLEVTEPRGLDFSQLRNLSQMIKRDMANGWNGLSKAAALSIAGTIDASIPPAPIDGSRPLMELRIVVDATMSRDELRVHPAAHENLVVTFQQADHIRAAFPTAMPEFVRAG
jgi:hypothetical protein